MYKWDLFMMVETLVCFRVPMRGSNGLMKNQPNKNILPASCRV